MDCTASVALEKQSIVTSTFDRRFEIVAIVIVLHAIVVTLTARSYELFSPLMDSALPE